MSSSSACNHSRDYQIRLPLRGRPILLITRMSADRIGLHSVLLPLLIVIIAFVTFFGRILQQYCIFPVVPIIRILHLLLPILFHLIFFGIEQFSTECRK